MTGSDDALTKLEERLLEDLLDHLEVDPFPEPTEADPQATLVREYVETLGLMPFEMDPVTPSESVKKRIMQAAEGTRPGVARGEDVAPMVPMPASGWRRLALPLAAGVALAMLGVSSWQYTRLQSQSGTIERLASQLSEANKMTAELTESRHELEAAQRKLALVTSHGVEICPLQPIRSSQDAGELRGTLFVTANHQSWYLHIDGLEPCPQGRAYQLWFVMSDGSSASGGLLEAKSGTCLEVTADGMPVGTIAISVTLEPAGGSSAPSGPEVLYGDELTRIL